MMPAYTYILRCADGRYYYGSTSDLLQRLARHRTGRARATKGRLPIRLVYFEEHQTLEQAKQREQSFKKGRTRRKTIDHLVVTFPPRKLAPFA